MKHYRDYKKQFSLLIKASVLFFILGVSIFLPMFFSNAQTAQEVQNKIQERNSDIERLEQEIANYQKELVSVSKQKNTLSSVLRELDLTRKKLVADINLTEIKIIKKNIEIQGLSSEIGLKENSISNNTKALSLDIKKIYELEQESLPEILLQTQDLTSMWNDVDNMATLREAILTKINNLKEIKGNLEVTKTSTESVKEELLNLKSKLADDKKIIEQNTNQKNKLLKDTKNSESAYQKLLKDKIAKKDALEKEVRDYESQLKFILDPSTLPSGGVLSWPLDNVYVTQLFGKTSSSKRLYSSGSHSGVDFRASVGTPVKAMADGTVLGFGDTDATCAGASFGKWVLIEYNNGLSSAYGHLSLSKVEKGQKVSRGEIVAYSGNTGHTTGPHLHVTIYASSAVSVKTLPSKSCAGKTLTQPIAATNAYLDPMIYLPVYKQ